MLVFLCIVVVYSSYNMYRIWIYFQYIKCLIICIHRQLCKKTALIYASCFIYVSLQYVCIVLGVLKTCQFFVETNKIQILSCHSVILEQEEPFCSKDSIYTLICLHMLIIIYHVICGEVSIPPQLSLNKLSIRLSTMLYFKSKWQRQQKRAGMVNLASKMAAVISVNIEFTSHDI